MRTSPTKRALVALTITLALLAGSAAPASADPTVSGTLIIGAEEFPIPGGPGNCPQAISTPITFTSDPAFGTWDASAGFWKLPFQLSGSPQKYQAEVDFLSTSVGVYTRIDDGPPPIYLLAGRLDLRIVLQTLTKSGSPQDPFCTKANVCTVQTRLLLGPSIHTGSLPTPAPGDTTTIDASSANPGGINTFAVGGSCPVTLQSALVGKVASMALILSWP